MPPINEKLLKTASYCAVFISLGLVMASLGPTLPVLAANTQTELRGISFLFTARSLGFLLGAFSVGRLYDRLPGHVVISIALLLMIGLMILIPLVPLLGVLTAVLLLLGVAESMVDLGTNTLLVWLHQHNVGPYMNALHFFFGVGAFLSPIIIAQAMLVSGDVTWAYWSLALLIVPSLLWLANLSSPPIRAVSGQGQSRPINYRLVLLIAIFFFLYVGAEVSFGGWIFTYAVALELANQTAAAYLTSAFWGALTMGRLLSIPLASRFRPRYILLVDLIGSLVSVGLILFWSNSLIVVWLGTFGVGVSMASIFPTTLALAERRMSLTGKVTGFIFAGASLGGMTIPWLIGQWFDSIGPRVTMMLIGASLVLALLALLGLLLYAKQSPSQEPHSEF